MNFFIEYVDIDLGDYVLDGSFVHSHFTKYLMTSALSTKEYNYLYNCSTSKEVGDTLKIIYE